LTMARTPQWAWGVVSGLAWGLAFWVSLYEPLILAATVLGTQLLFFRQTFFVRERLWELGVLASVLGIALLVEGWHVQMPDETTKAHFMRWRETVGELSSVGVLSPLVFRWVGFGLFLTPVLLITRLRDARRSIILLVLFVVTFSLTLMQVRWGYYFALVFAISLPWQLSPFVHRRLIVWALFMVSLWPVLREWDEKLFPTPAGEAEAVARRRDAFWLRDAAEHFRDGGTRAVLAPWWLSPAFHYWSGQPAVAGSSHESLPGSVATARFYLSEDVAEAEQILRARQVSLVLAEEPERLLQTSAVLLGRVTPASGFAMTLYRKPHSVPAFLELSYTNPLFKVFDVRKD
jgi:hypothetical protein